MPLDSSIALQYRPPQFENQLANYGNFMAIQNAGNQNRLAEIQYRNALRAEADNAALRQSLQGVDISTPKGLQAARNALLRVGDIKGAQALDKNALDTLKTRGEIGKTGIETEAAKAKLLRDQLASVNDQAGYDAWRQTGAALGAKVAINSPPVFDPAFKAQNLATADEWLKRNAPTLAEQETVRNNILVDERTRRGQDMTDARSRQQMGQAERHFQANQGAASHFTNTVADDGTVRVNAFDKAGNLIKTTEPGGKTPSFLSNENVRERQLSTSLEKVKAPHLDVLNAYQRFEQIKGTGDNAQANQFLAQQLMQMSKTGQRVIPKAELERILGSGDLGNDWIGRAANMVTQMAAGVRTPTIDKRLNDLADAMARGSADRIGQEIQNTRARTPPGVDPSRVVGATPTIYGRFIITPTGKVHAFNSSAEAQAKLDEASKIVGQ